MFLTFSDLFLIIVLLMESFLFTVVWFTVQEGEVIDGDVSVKIIPDGSFYHDLTKRRGREEESKRVRE